MTRDSFILRLLYRSPVHSPVRSPIPGPDRGPVRLRSSVLTIVLSGIIYGTVMGSFGGIAGDRWRQPVYAAVKVPMLLGITFAMALPGFFMMNTLAGLRADAGRAVRAVASAQAGVAVTLASLAPFTGLVNVSTTSHPAVLLFNGGMFAIAAAAGQLLIRRAYRPLIAVTPRHRTLLIAWSAVYCLIAIQMAWTLRPFVGGPGEPVSFVRPTAWGNAYQAVAEVLWQQITG
jgi:hypothetical protein